MFGSFTAGSIEGEIVVAIEHRFLELGKLTVTSKVRMAAPTQ
jgi:hypothetical protein